MTVKLFIQSSETMFLMVLVSLFSILVGAAECGTADADCAVSFQDKDDVCVCSTANTQGPVKCNSINQRIEVEPCYCVYYDHHLNKVIVGRCYFTCYQYEHTVIEVTNSTVFNDDFCYSYSEIRSGFFCYECIGNYSMAAYSKVLIYCVPCQDYGYKNWLQTFAVSLLPMTLFYILAVLLSFNITSSSLSGVILVIQCIVTSPVRTYMNVFTSFPNDGDYNIFVKIFFGLLEIVDLDFFRVAYSPVCLHPNINVFEIQSLSYIMTLFPFLLIFITYLLITAYDSHYRVLVWIWKPFKICVLRYRKTWNIRTSLVEIFASFIFLSSVRIMSVSARILSFILTYDVAGNKVSTVVTASANVKYFSPQHLPFALFAITISSIFVALPLLLLVVYPCRCFHKCLNSCGLRLQVLHVFMDAFQGSYKLQPRDMRYFSAFYLFLRVVMVMHADLFLSPLTLYTSGIISLASAAIVAAFRPFKVEAHNTIDSILLLLMGVYFISCNETSLALSLGYGNNWILPSILQGLSISLIALYLISLLLWKLFYKILWKVLLEKARQLFQKVKSRRSSSEIENDREEDVSMIGSLVNDRDLLDVTTGTTERATY